MQDRIMLFIPMYNCEKQIGRVLDKFDQDTQKLFGEIVVIDNISPDKSIENAVSSLQRFHNVKTTVLRNDQNYSLGGSIKVAWDYAIRNGYEYVITLHGDDQGNIQDIVPFIKGREYKDYDIVVGARFHKDSSLHGYPFIRIAGNYGFNFLCTVITGKKIYDMIAGLNIFKVSFLTDKFYLGFPNNLTFDAHVLLYAISHKKSIKYIPISWSESDQVSNAKVVRQGITLLKLFLYYLLFRKSMFKNLSSEFSDIDYTSEVIHQRDIEK